MDETSCDTRRTAFATVGGRVSTVAKSDVRAWSVELDHASSVKSPTSSSVSLTLVVVVVVVVVVGLQL